MAFEDEFRNMMAATVTVETVSSEDEYGARTFNSAITYDARVVEKLQSVVNFEGHEQVSTHVVYIAPHASSGIPAVESNSQITLPDGTTPPILRVEVYPDDDGDHHFAVFLGAVGS